MSTDIEPRRDTGLQPTRPGEVTLAGAVRLVLPPAAPGERYHLRGLTELWADMIGRDSAHTRRSYETGLAQWLDYYLRSRVDPLQARRADVDDWLAAHLNSHNAETVITRLAAVGSWYGYLVDNDIDVRDPTARVKRPKRQRTKSKTPYLDEDELNALLAEADRRLQEAQQFGGLALEIAARDVAVLRTLYTTAVRSGAVQHAAVADVRLVEDGHRVLRFHGKGDGRETTERLKPLVPYAAAAVDFYLALVADRLGVPVGQLDGHAFRTTPYQGRRRGRELRSDALIDMMRTIAITADIAPDKIVKLSPHSLRHTAATLLGKTKTLAEVQDFLTTPTPAQPVHTCTPTSRSTPRWPTAPWRSSRCRPGARRPRRDPRRYVPFRFACGWWGSPDGHPWLRRGRSAAGGCGRRGRCAALRRGGAAGRRAACVQAASQADDFGGDGGNRGVLASRGARAEVGGVLGLQLGDGDGVPVPACPAAQVERRPQIRGAAVGHRVLRALRRHDERADRAARVPGVHLIPGQRQRPVHLPLHRVAGRRLVVGVVA
ncbi:tyrosine-type recombinase/integrase [Amycolatopsis sp. NPDC047767]|uniref:tyrosine-type recombinase/integrase n=1 Tax=Amycolatopsis sp. NPDC047767 TaxID=3156765 RepID=UPI0034519C49